MLLWFLLSKIGLWHCFDRELYSKIWSPLVFFHLQGLLACLFKLHSCEEEIKYIKSVLKYLCIHTHIHTFIYIYILRTVVAWNWELLTRQTLWSWILLWKWIGKLFTEKPQHHRERNALMSKEPCGHSSLFAWLFLWCRPLHKITWVGE